MEDGAGGISAGAHDNRRDVEGQVTRTGENAKARLGGGGANRRNQLHLTEMANRGRVACNSSANGLAHVAEDNLGDAASAINGSDDESLEASGGGNGHGARSDELIGIQGAADKNGASVVVGGLGGDLTNKTGNG